MTADTFLTYSRSYACPHHGPDSDCTVCGSRGLWVTWQCGRVAHLDALRATQAKRRTP